MFTVLCRGPKRLLWEPSGLGVGVSERSSWKRWFLSKILQDRWSWSEKKGRGKGIFGSGHSSGKGPEQAALTCSAPHSPSQASGRCPCCPCLSYPLHDTCPPPTLPPQGLGKCPKPHLQGPLADELMYEPLFKGTLTFSFFKKNIIHWWLHYHDCKAYTRTELGQSRKVKGNKKSPIMPATIRCPQLTRW